MAVNDYYIYFQRLSDPFGGSSQPNNELLRNLADSTATTLNLLTTFNKKVDTLMTQIQDLSTAVARLKQDVTDELKAISGRLSASSNVDDPAVAQAVSDLNTLADNVESETGTLNAAGGPGGGPGGTPTGRGPSAGTPTITGVSPTSGPAGTNIVIAGSNFTTTQGAVTVGGISATVNSWSDTSISATTPAATPAGSAPVIVTANGVNSAPASFTAQ